MSSKRVSAAGFAAELENVIKQYSDDVVRDLPQTVKNVAKKTVKELKSAAGSAVGGSRYKASFTSKVTESSSTVTEVTIYSKIPGLTQLLEHGHAIKNQYGVYGVSAAHPHWAKAEDYATEELEKEIQRKVEEAS